MIDKLKLLRLQKNLTLEEMGNYFGVNRQTYTNWESGKNEPPNETLCKIADFFGVTTDYLLGRSNDNFFSNSFNNNTINSTTGGGDEMTKQLLSKFNDLDFDQKIKVFTYISNLKEK